MILYIIHGWTYTVAPWEQTIECLKKYGITVKMLHVPGLTATSTKVWTIDDYVAWANQELPNGAIALGHSNGGRILLNICLKYPDKLKELILLDSAGIYEPSRKRDLSRLLSKTFGFMKQVPGVERLWHKLTGSSDYAKAPQNMKLTLANMLDSDKLLDASQVKVKTEIIWGEADDITPVRQAKRLHQQIRGSKLRIFPEWNHAPYIKHPEELAKAIAEVITGTEACKITATNMPQMASAKGPTPTAANMPSLGRKE